MSEPSEAVWENRRRHAIGARLADAEARALAAESALAAAVAQAETLRQAGGVLAERLAMHVAMARQEIPNDTDPKNRCVMCRRALDEWSAALSVSPSQGRVLTDDECEQVANALIVAGTQLPLPLNSEARRDVEAALALLVPARAGGKATDA